MSEQILLPYDGSMPSEKALEYALETFPDADLTALYVVLAPRGYWAAFEEPEDRIPNAERVKERGREILDEAAAMAADQDRDLETELIIGEPEHVIVGQAAEGGYDSIVIGSHGREGVSRVLLGSVAEKVVRRSPTPVVVVR
ncbi:UspA domain-containing protein [Natrialba chahannaoensis JCM 10990]|uniref:UspA domain-containing protein n=1 Tax=Natrialba chahannaoensis JCM 10990 TaxID=1227492 RepID=M0ABL5_9EURY|nr:universal stress protein [Natrialba chahannaoensis]ELY96135.1 UspA domain-containing protein [Natrialba chahannaoensis JCM 10990]